MALVKATDPFAAAERHPRSPALVMEGLASTDPAVRRDAARGLAGAADATAALGRALATEPDSLVREALLASLVSIGGRAVADVLAPMLRSSDAALRNGTIEALKQIGETAAATAVDAMLEDPDPSVRLLAIEVTRAWSGEGAEPRLRRLIEHDPHVNVCGAAVDVATEVGTPGLLGPLAGLRVRFADEEFLHFAVGIATARIAGEVAGLPPFDGARAPTRAGPDQAAR